MSSVNIAEEIKAKQVLQKKVQRKIEWGGFQDLPETISDKAVAEYGFSQLGIPKENTWVLTDPKPMEVKMAIMDIMKATIVLKN